MTSLNCRQCGFELPPQTNFCRRCGTRITADLPPQSEPVTRLFTNEGIGNTERVYSRPTSRNSPSPNISAPVIAKASRKPGRFALIVGVLFILGLVLITTVSIIRTRVIRDVVPAESLVYPGARKALDITDEGGGRALHLETSDSLEQVDEWYRENLKPDKIVKLSSTSVILKSDKAVATIVREGNQTNILIKMTP